METPFPWEALLRMSDLLASAASWLADQQAAHLAATVTYRRGAQSVSLAATRGRTEFDEPDAVTGFPVRQTSVDWLVTAAALVLSGDAAATLPARGDTIEETAAGVTTTYEVLPLGTSEQCFRPCDPAGYKLRVHTKRNSVA